MLVLVLTVILSVVFLVWWYIFYWVPPPRSPPTYQGVLPIIGHAHVVLKLLLGRNEIWNYFKEICDYNRENEGIVSLRMGPHFVYIASDLEDVSVIAKTCLDKAYFYKFTKPFFGNGLFISDTAEWKVQRKLLNPAFNSTILNTFINEINVQTQDLVKRLTYMAEKGPFDVQGYLTDFLLSLICRTLLGLTPEDQNMLDNDFSKAVDDIVRVYLKRGFTLWLYPSIIYNWSATKTREEEIVRNVENILNPIIQKRRSNLKESNNMNYDEYSQTSTGKFRPILDLLLHVADEQHVFTDENIRANLNAFAAGAYDTTSLTLQTILLALGSYPEVQEKLYKEVQEVFETHDDLDKNDLTKLVYVEAVIKEVMRLYPVGPFVARKLNTDVKLQKYTLRAGNTCILSLYDLNRHPSWGPDVMEFKPERWLNPETLPANPNVFGTFSIGQRNCIGKQYAVMCLKIALAYIVRKFHISGDVHSVDWLFEAFLKPRTPALVTLTLRP